MATAKHEMAIVAITRQGAELGRRLSVLLPESHLYVPDKFAGLPEEHAFAMPAAELVHDIFGKYRHLVLIMAVGIAVRLLAGKIDDKHKDPAVVVLDDSGKFAVSLLSGHIGGANELAGKIASLTGAQAVITTASENRGVVSFDLLAKRYGWAIEDGSDLTGVSAALVNGEEVGVFQDTGETDWQGDAKDINVFLSVEALTKSDCRAAVIISDRVTENSMLIPTVVFRPKSLVVGVGCNRGTDCAEIATAINRLFADNALSPESIRTLATIDIKKDEPGLLQFARQQSLQIEYFSKERLGAVTVPSKPSAATLKHVGTSVCEAAAILNGGNIIVPKTSFNRTVTLAIARLPFNREKKAGKLYLVGTGPGDLEQMTLRARQEIARSDVVVGYKSYIEQIKPLLAGKEVIATGMGKEIERVTRAIEAAAGGKKVSLVSGGDSGIYGLAGLVGEMLRANGTRLDVEVIPGIPAMVAAGALLGAPLNVDVALISLSDHLLSWKQIARRLDAAAQGDFVIALYNPKSKQRQHQLDEAREIVLRYRSAATPVGIVSNAYRPEQIVTVTDLGHLPDYDVDMNTILIIGNSTTVTLDNWMVTPRGYHNKYDLGMK
ncbi:MAG: precorrin-3B C(17)-methyltransferase [Dehalococcoidales bacterium]|nr:precorrin-3B C(17)-methyltransferase [Dehalococcoidales bacterium]